MNYKDKLKLAKDALESGSYDEKTIKYIFPELAESEDERIRKEMISWLKGFIGEEEGCGYTEDEIRERIAWLEKQGEQKPQRMVSAEAKEAMYNKPAWSEEDEDKLTSCIAAITACYQWDSMIEWLKSLKERVHPKQEWSEEDKRKISRIYSVLGEASDEHAFFTTNRILGDKECIELQDFLKFLRLQLHWKPSKEQKNALYHIVRDFGKDKSEDEMLLESLLYDLDKL